jgi:sterol desaturase/sphingolipid hydroxylase (fatty acid hydroxylase superfamily)
VYGHLGFELYPAGFNKHWLGKWLNTSVSHNMHHHYFRGNYGLYFTLWDRIMGTLSKNYDKEYEEVMSRKNMKEFKMQSNLTT